MTFGHLVVAYVVSIHTPALELVKHARDLLRAGGGFQLERQEDVCTVWGIVPVYEFRDLARVYNRVKSKKTEDGEDIVSRLKFGTMSRGTCVAYLPGCSGISTLSNASLPSPSSARSATNRKRSKFILAPLITATNFFLEPMSWLSVMCLFKPAKAKAPAGSVTERVSVSDMPRKIRKKDHLKVRTEENPFPHMRSRTFEYVFDGRTNLVIVDLDYAIEEPLTDAKGLLTNNAHCRAIAERANFGKGDAVALLQTARHRVPIYRLDADDVRPRTADAFNVFAYA